MTDERAPSVSKSFDAWLDTLPDIDQRAFQSRRSYMAGYAAALATAPAPDAAAITYVCPIKDIICGSRPENWCDECPLKRKSASPNAALIERLHTYAQTWYDGGAFATTSRAPKLAADISEAAETLARLSAPVPREPICYLRLHKGGPDWAEDCVSGNASEAMAGYEEEDGYSAIPLYK